MSKGSKPRPLSVDKDTFDSNWDRIFRAKREKVLDELAQLGQDMGDYGTPATQWVVITSCSDPLLWYKDKVGDSFKVIVAPISPGHDWLVATRDEYSTTNIIKPCDCKSIDE